MATPPRAIYPPSLGYGSLEAAFGRLLFCPRREYDPINFPVGHGESTVTKQGFRNVLFFLTDAGRVHEIIEIP